jgi:hypothetical protein
VARGDGSENNDRKLVRLMDAEGPALLTGGLGTCMVCGLTIAARRLVPPALPGSTGGAQRGEDLAGQPLDLFVLAGPDRDEVHGGEAELGEGAQPLGDGIWGARHHRRLGVGALVDADAEVVGAGELIGVPAGRAGSRQDPLTKGGDLLGWRIAERGDPSVGQLAGQGQGAPAVGAQPDGMGWSGLGSSSAPSVRYSRPWKVNLG